MGSPAATPSFPDYTPTVPEFLRRSAAQFGDKELIVLGERRLGYASAERESNGVGERTRAPLSTIREGCAVATSLECDD